MMITEISTSLGHNNYADPNKKTTLCKNHLLNNLGL